MPRACPLVFEDLFFFFFFLSSSVRLVFLSRDGILFYEYTFCFLFVFCLFVCFVSALFFVVAYKLVTALIFKSNIFTNLKQNEAQSASAESAHKGCSSSGV